MILGRTLGQCVLEVKGERLTPESEVVFALLLYLASHAGRAVPRRELVRLLWPAADDTQARHCLRQTLYRLRRFGAPLAGGEDEISLPRNVVSLDYEAIVEAPTPLEGVTRTPPGPYLPAYTPRFSRGFAEWVEQQREVVHARMRRAILAAIGELRERGRFAEVEALARTCLVLDPLNEEATLALAEATAMSGAKAEALGILDRYLDEVGGDAPELRLPATVLRRRIAERLPSPRYALSLEPALVGREGPLAELTAEWAASRGGSARAALIWGDPGIGKTRLATELTKIAIVQGARVERVRCQPIDLRRPLSIFVELVPHLLALRGAAGVAPESMGYLRRITDIDASGERGTGGEPEDAEALHASVCRALYDLVDAVSAEVALILFVDDAHWLDATSWRVLAEMHRRCAGRRLLLLLTSREAPSAIPSPDAGALARAGRTLRLGPIDDAAAAALVDSALSRRGGALRAELRSSCVRRAAGNPYFLTELVAHALAGRGDATLPLTLQSLLEERLAALRAPAARALQVVALLGRAASLERVEAVLGAPTHELIDAFEELDAAGLLAVDGALLSCRHELLASEAVGRLSAASRLVLHRHAARVLEAEIESGRSAALLWECAEHWTRAGDAGRVVRLAETCAEQLVEVGSAFEALEVLQKGLDYTRSGASRLGLLERIARTARGCGNWIAAREAITEIRRLVDAADGALTADEFQADYLESLFRTNAPTEEILPAALRYITDVTRSPGSRLRTSNMILVLSANTGNEDAARGAHEAAKALVLDTTTSREAYLYNCLFYHARFGELTPALAAGLELVERARSGGEPRSLCRALRFASVPLVFRGETETVLQQLEESFTLAEQHGLWGEAWPAADALAHYALERDNLDLARFWLERLIPYQKRSGIGPFFAGTHSHLSTRISIAVNDRAAVEANLADVGHHASAFRLVRPRQHLRATLLHAQSFLGILDPATVQTELLQRDYEALCRHGGEDYAVAIMCMCLNQLGQHGTSRRILTEYLSLHRRETYPPQRLLAEVAHSAAIDA